MEIIVNGDRRTVPDDLTVASLLEVLQMRPNRVAIERNRDILPRAQWQATQVQPNDNFEIVQFVGGGESKAASKDLVRLSGRIAELLQSVPRLRDPLDFLLGAVYALWLADELGFHERDLQLPNDYWQFPLKRAQDMAAGALRTDGKWAAGFYFNSALLRIAASYHRTLKALTRQDGYVPALREKVAPPFSRSNLDKVHCEVNHLKHTPNGIESGRRITFAIAIDSVNELLDLIHSHRADF